MNSGHVSFSDNYLDYNSDDDDDEQSFYIHTLNTLSSQPDQVFVKLSVGRLGNHAEIYCKIDTGSQINCLPFNFVFKCLKLNLPLEPPNATTAYTGNRFSRWWPSWISNRHDFSYF